MPNSRQKGKRGERELAEFIRQFGFTARRGVQYQGGADSPDVVTNIPGTHFECKFTEALQLYQALEQAKTDKRDGEIPIVAHRKKNKPWVAIMPLEDLMNLLKNGPKPTEGAVCVPANGDA